MRSGFVGVVCWSVLVGVQTIIATPTDAPTDAGTEAPTDAAPTTAPPTTSPPTTAPPTTAPPTTAPPTTAPPTTAPAPATQVEFVVTLALKDGFTNVNGSSLMNAVKGQFPKGSEVVSSLEYKVSAKYDFAEAINKSDATKGIAALCSVNESQVSVTIGGGGRRLLIKSASPRRLSTSVEAVITSTTPDAAANVHTAAGNASGIANAMSDVTGQTIAEPTVTPPKASIAVTTSVTAPTDGSTDITALSNLAQSSNFTTTLATLANATVTIENVQVITAAPTAAPAGSPTTAPAAASTTNPTNSSNTTASPSTTGAKETTNIESFAAMRWPSCTVAMAIVFELMVTLRL